MTFGEKLKSTRKGKGLTQKELAGIIDAAHNSVSNWENDQNRPDTETILALCSALNVTPDFFFLDAPQHAALVERTTSSKRVATKSEDSDLGAEESIIDRVAKEYGASAAELLQLFATTPPEMRRVVIATARAAANVEG